MASRKKVGVREPVQVYLTLPDRKLLKEVAIASGLSGAEVLRRGLRRMAGEILAERNPVMSLLAEMASGAWSPDTPCDVGENHDAYLAAVDSPAKTPRKRAGKRR